MTGEKIRVRKVRDRETKYPWGAHYPCCPFMNSRQGGGWPTWRSAMGQVARHLNDLHAESEGDA